MTPNDTPDGPAVGVTAVHPGVAFRVESEGRSLVVASGLPDDGGPQSPYAGVGTAPSRRDPRPGRSSAGTSLDGLPATAWDDLLDGDPDALVVLRRPAGSPAVDVPADRLPGEVYVPEGEGSLPAGLEGATPLADGETVDAGEADLRARAVDPTARPTVAAEVTTDDRRALLAGPLPRGVRSLVPDGEDGESGGLVDRLDGGPSGTDLLAVGAGTDRSGFRALVRKRRPSVVHVTGAGENRRGDWASERLVRSARAASPGAHVSDPWVAPATVTLGDERGELRVDGGETWREADGRRPDAGQGRESR